MTKMTMKEFLTAVSAIEGIKPELAEFAIAEIAKIDGKNAKRRATVTDTQKANAELLNQVVSGMTENQVITASEVATAYDISTQKASAILSNGVKSGLLVSEEIKIKGKGKVKGYSKPKTEKSE